MIDQTNEILPALSQGISANSAYIATVIGAFIASFIFVKVFYKLIQVVFRLLAVSTLAFLMLEYGPAAVELLHNEELQAATEDKIIQSTNELKTSLITAVGQQIAKN